MRKIVILSIMFGLAIAGSLYSVTFNLSGHVPRSITHDFLKSNYLRIAAQTAYDLRADSTPLSIIYYSKTDKRLLGVRLPEWGGGGALGKDTIIIPVDNQPLLEMDIDRITVHELVHIVLERAYGRLRLPRWFHEGLAMTLSGELAFEEQIVLSRAILTKSLIPLDSIDFVNRFNRTGADCAYSESHVAVQFLIETYGIDGIPELLDSAMRCGRFDDAFNAVFGFTGLEFQSTIQNHIADRYKYLFFAADTYIYWIPGALLVVLAYILIRIRNAKKRKLMEEEEAREDAEEMKAQEAVDKINDTDHL